MLCLLFGCCVCLLLSSIQGDDREFLATFGKGERGGVFYIPLSSLKFVDSVYASQHCVALVLGATQTNKNSLVAKNSCTRHNTEGVQCSSPIYTLAVWSSGDTCTVCGHPTTTNWEYMMCIVCGHPTTMNWEYMCTVSHYYELGVHMCTVLALLSLLLLLFCVHVLFVATPPCMYKIVAVLAFALSLLLFCVQ